MKKTILLSLFLMIIGLSGCENNNDTFNLSIIHINDSHSHLESESMYLTLAGESTKVEVGGYPRIATKIKELQAKEENTLTLNAGDMFQGTLYYSLFKGEADATLVNTIAWDAISLGNHEFDDGDEHLLEYLSLLETQSSKILAANIEVPETNPLYNKWSSYTIKTFPNGEKVGVIGIDIVGKTKNSSNPSDEVVFYDEVTTAQKYIDELTALGINKIVLLSHVGLDNDKAYALQLEGVDVIVGGDSHSLMGNFSSVGLSSEDNNYPYETTDKNGNTVCIVQAWEYNHIVGNLHIDFDKNGVVTNCSGTPHLLIGDTFMRKNTEWEDIVVDDALKAEILEDIKNKANIEVITKDSEVAAILEHYSTQVETKKLTLIGEASERLGHNRIPKDIIDSVESLPLGSNIAPIVAKAFYDLSNRSDACIQNAGGVRTAIEKGDITVGDAYTLLPFANTLYEIEMTGAEVKNVLEDALEEALIGGDDATISTGAFPYAYALRYDVNGSTTYGKRIGNLEIKDRLSGIWSDINLSKNYVIVTNNYIAFGKDGYFTFGSILEEDPSKGVNTYLDYALSFVEYVEKKTENGEMISKLYTQEHPIKSYTPPVK